VLIPLEDECEEHDGLTPESHAAAKRAVLDAGFNAINHPVADGGRGFDTFQQMLIEEQWGHATRALWDIPWRPSIPLQPCTDAQRARYLHRPIRRRASRCLRDHRGGRGLRRLDGDHDRSPGRGRLGARR
jgi:alkylation response protein AidB-like acyl-CoA dehydrogenase